jgi:glycosyltransferase involved in cell wall biosynthesis
VLAQTYEEWEAIIVDDGSTDRPDGVVRKIKDKRIRFFQLPQNVGRGAARNFALTKTRGRYTAILDGDDWLYPSKLQSQIKIMQSDRQLILCSSPLVLVNVNNSLSGIGAFTPDFCDKVVIGKSRPHWVHVPFPSSLMRSSEAREVGFNEHLKRSEDFDFLMKLLWGQPFYLMAKPLYSYRIQEELTTNSSMLAARESLQSCRQTLKNYEMEFPITARFMMLQSYGLLARTFLRRKLQIPSLPRQANEQETRDFEDARALVASHTNMLSKH